MSKAVLFNIFFIVCIFAAGFVAGICVKKSKYGSFFKNSENWSIFIHAIAVLASVAAIFVSVLTFKVQTAQQGEVVDINNSDDERLFWIEVVSKGGMNAAIRSVGLGPQGNDKQWYKLREIEEPHIMQHGEMERFKFSEEELIHQLPKIQKNSVSIDDLEMRVHTTTNTYKKPISNEMKLFLTKLLMETPAPKVEASIK